MSLHNAISHPHKRLQHLAGRYLLRQLYPVFPLKLIRVADTNKPYLHDEAFHFSISHCGDYAASIVSSKNRVGTDIEVIQPKIYDIRYKFLTESELLLLENVTRPFPETLTLCWSIKEAIFKWYGAGKVDFRGHMHIKEIIFSDDLFTAQCLFNKHEEIALQVEGVFFNHNCLTWVVS